jgi:cellulose synthase/poly-beta-1,6-N-acetylglucosamine synthase-like glycosyltransferase
MYQWMESRALMASGMGLFRLKMPVMCNGANLVFNKDGWKEVGGYEGKKAILGGDDIFLMHALWKKDPTKIGYCLDEEAVVYTAPHKQFGKFMRQRKRWANKTGKYDLAFANIIPFLVAGVNLFILVCFILLLVSGEWGLAFGLLVAKALVDYYNIVSLKQGFRNCVSFVMILQYQLFFTSFFQIRLEKKNYVKCRNFTWIWNKLPSNSCNSSERPLGQENVAI